MRGCTYTLTCNTRRASGAEQTTRTLQVDICSSIYQSKIKQVIIFMEKKYHCADDLIRYYYVFFQLKVM